MTEHDDPLQLPPTGEAAHPSGGGSEPGDTAPRDGSWSFVKGDRIGPYILRDALGRGGFGEVWRAERRSPNMTVAVKVVRRDKVDANSLARFSAECQALAMLDHPFIARIHEAGVTETGSPYLAMEYIHGVPLREFCDREMLGIDERLAIVAKLCDAVHHAHTQGIIHRDLKPDNILVSIHEGGEATPKVVDFGIAKAVNKNTRLSDVTITQDLHTTIGTPLYMSPEQLESTQAGVDTRTDIFALGVVLYELLAGVLPMTPGHGTRGGLDELLRFAREQRPEPAPRFASLSEQERATIALRRGRMRPQALEKLLRSRLRHLPMKAMRPERNKRFSSAAAMAQDIRHYLAGESFAEAAAEGRLERFGRSVQRNKLAYGSGAMIVLLLAGWTATATVALQRALAAEEAASFEAARASEAEERAVARANELALAAEFQRSQLGAIEPAVMGAQIREDVLSEAGSRWRRAGLDEGAVAERAAALGSLLDGVNMTNIAMRTLERNLFDQTLAAIDERFASQPLLRAQLLQSAAKSLRELGLHGSAIVPQREARSVFVQALGEEDLSSIVAGVELARALRDAGELGEAEALIRRVLESAERSLGPDDPATLAAIGVLAHLRSDAGDLQGALVGHRQAMEGWRRAGSELDAAALTAAANYGAALRALGRSDEAEPYYRLVLEGRRRTLGDDAPDTLAAMNNAGVLLLESLDRPEEAEPLLLGALQGRRRVLGDAHPGTIATMTNVGVLRLRQGRRAEAGRVLREAHASSTRVLGPSHPSTLSAAVNLAGLKRDSGDLAGAESLLQEAADGARVSLGERHPTTLRLLHDLADVLARSGRLGEAGRLFAEVLDGRRETHGLDHPYTSATAKALGDVRAAMGDAAGAETIYRELLETHTRRGEAERRQAWAAASALASVLQRQGRRADAAPVLERAAELAEAEFGRTHPNTLTAVHTLGAALLEEGRFEDAAAVLGPRVSDAREAWTERDGSALGLYLLRLGAALLSTGRASEAEPVLLEAHALLAGALGEGHGYPRQAAAMLASLYETLHNAEPGAGHDASAVRWRGLATGG
ncbi:MAG: serine/threonine protein kinase [Phycisphaerales bacterium]|nr:serine/threonine protein kinase [Phycisphaerales bacterium]